MFFKGENLSPDGGRNLHMDYDDKEFQIRNTQLAGEGSANFPSGVRSYTVPKFEFDESFQAHLKFDSLVETEGFLSVESQEGNNWIEDFSRGSSAILFNSCGLPSCGFLRHKNAWLEVTSSESVEMLLKSVGQEEMDKVPHAMEGSDGDERADWEQKVELNHGGQVLPKVTDLVGLVSELRSDKLSGNLDQLKGSDGRQPIHVDPAEQNHEGESCDGGTSARLCAYLVNDKCATLLDEKRLTIEIKNPDGNYGDVYASEIRACQEAESRDSSIEFIEGINQQRSLGHAIDNENTDLGTQENFDSNQQSFENSDWASIDNTKVMVDTVVRSSNVDISETFMLVSDVQLKADEVDDRTKTGEWNRVDDEKLIANSVVGGANDKPSLSSMLLSDFELKTDEMDDRIKNSDYASMDDEKSIVNDMAEHANDRTLESSMSVSDSGLEADKVDDITTNLDEPSDITGNKNVEYSFRGLNSEICEDKMNNRSHNLEEPSDAAITEGNMADCNFWLPDQGEKHKIMILYPEKDEKLIRGDSLEECGSNIRSRTHKSNGEAYNEDACLPKLADREKNFCDVFDPLVGVCNSKTSLPSYEVNMHSEHTKENQFCGDGENDNTPFITCSSECLPPGEECRTHSQHSKENQFCGDGENDNTPFITCSSEYLPPGEECRAHSEHSKENQFCGNGENDNTPFITCSSEYLPGEECRTPLVQNETNSKDVGVAHQVASSISSGCLSIYKHNVVCIGMDACESNSDACNIGKRVIELASVSINMEHGAVETGHTDATIGPGTKHCSRDGSLGDALFIGQTESPMHESDIALEAPALVSCDPLNAVSSDTLDMSIRQEVINSATCDEAVAVGFGVSALDDSPPEKCSLVCQSEKSLGVALQLPCSISSNCMDDDRSSSYTHNFEKNEVMLTPMSVKMEDEAVEISHANVISVPENMQRSCVGSLDDVLFEGQTDRPMHQSEIALEAPLLAPNESLNSASSPTADTVVCREVISRVAHDEVIAVESTVLSLEDSSQEKCTLDMACQSERVDANINSMQVLPEALKDPLSPDEIDNGECGTKAGDNIDNNVNLSEGINENPSIQCEANDGIEGNSVVREDKVETKSLSYIKTDFVEASETLGAKDSRNEVEIVAHSLPSCLQEGTRDDIQNDREASIISKGSDEGQIAEDHETPNYDSHKGTGKAVDPSTSVWEMQNDESRSACSVPIDDKERDTSKADTSFAFETTSLSDPVEKETIRYSQVFSIPLRDMQLGTPTHSSNAISSRIDLRGATEVFHGNSRTPVGHLSHGVSRSTLHCKTKRSGKIVVNETERNLGGLSEYMMPERKNDKGDTMSVNSPSVFSEGKSVSRQHSFKKSCVQTPSYLPDLNASASPSLAFQQPFTDLQQLQLRAQIFVYGSLIQGTVPDEACMTSAFGESGCGRPVWENVWHASFERAHERNSRLCTPDISSLPRPGTRPESTGKLGPHNKVLSSAVGRESATTTSPAVKTSTTALSSPLWSISTPCNGSSISNSMMKGPGPAMDSHQTLYPFQLYQSSPLVSHAALFSQGPFPISSYAPTVEMVQSTPIVHSSSVKNMHDTTVVDASLRLKSSAIVTPSCQYSIDHKAGKKKTFTDEAPGPTSYQTRLIENSPSIACKDFGNVLTAALPKQSSALIGNKIKEALLQAEEAAAAAAAAVSHSQHLWAELDKQKGNELAPDLEARLSAAAVAVATAASVAKAAAAAAKVASTAALQAKRMAEEAFVSSGAASSQNNSEDFDILGMATPASILKGSEGMSAGSIILAAREATRRKVEVASAASKRAENIDSIVKAAELAAEAVSLASRIAAMNDPFPLNELIEMGLNEYRKLTQISAKSAIKGKTTNICEQCKFVSEQGNDAFSTDSRKTLQVTNVIGPAAVNQTNVGDVSICSEKESEALNTKNENESLPEVEVISKSDSLNADTDFDASTSNCLKEGSLVEIRLQNTTPTWALARIISLKDGKACLYYVHQPSAEDSECSTEWIEIDGSKNECPRIRAARSCPTVRSDGTRKRPRTGMREKTWSVGDRVDAWMQNRWCEGVVVEKSKDDETELKIQYPGQDTIFPIRVWHVRPSLVWQDGQWNEWSGSNEKKYCIGSDTPHGKRPRLEDPLVEKCLPENVPPSEKQEGSKLFLSAGDNTFNVGKNPSDEDTHDVPRTVRAGLQKEGSRVIFGVPKQGKKRKFMDVSKHLISDRSSKVNEPSDSAKLARYLVPQRPGPKNDLSKLRTGSAPKFANSGKAVNGSKTLSQNENSMSRMSQNVMSENRGGEKSSSMNENLSGKLRHPELKFSASSHSCPGNANAFQSSYFQPDAKKFVGQSAKTAQSSKAGPSGAKFGRIEEMKVGNAVKSTSQVEPRRSNRRIQPTSRLLEGLESSFSVGKAPSISHDRSQKGLKNNSRVKRE